MIGMLCIIFFATSVQAGFTPLNPVRTGVENQVINPSNVVPNYGDRQIVVSVDKAGPFGGTNPRIVRTKIECISSEGKKQYLVYVNDDKHQSYSLKIPSDVHDGIDFNTDFSQIKVYINRTTELFKYNILHCNLQYYTQRIHKQVQVPYSADTL